MPLHMTPEHITKVLEIVVECVKITGIAFGAWQASRANHHVKEVKALHAESHEEIKNISAEVNGRMSEVIRKIPDIGASEFPHRIQEELEEENFH